MRAFAPTDEIDDQVGSAAHFAKPAPIRVCFLIDELNTAGTETQLLALIGGLDRRRVQPVLALLRGGNPDSQRLEPAKCPVQRLEVGSLTRPRTLVKAWRFGSFLRHKRIDVLQVYFPDSTYFGALACRFARSTRLVRTRNNLGYWLTPLHRQLGRWCNRWTAATIANCEAARQALLADECPDAKSVVVLENGVDAERFAGIAPLSATQPLRRVGVLANLRPVKDLDLFLRAAARVAEYHPTVTFEIAGEGDQRPALETLAAELGLKERLRLSGKCADVPAFLARIDVAVLCSQSEGMSNAVLEYMAAGRAIVATRVGANAQLLDDGRCGILVPAGNLEQLVGGLDRLLTAPGIGCRLGAAARRRAEEHYGRPAMIRRFEGFYECLMGVSPGGRDVKLCQSMNSLHQKTRREANAKTDRYATPS